MKRKIMIQIVGILLAFLLGALVMVIQGKNPMEAYYQLFAYSLGSPNRIAFTLNTSVPLVLTGLSAAIAFASGPINLGQPGQLLIGALFATIAGLYLDLPSVVVIPLLLILAIIGGALWSGIAALCRYYFKMSEFITTLMLNFIADYLTLWAISYPFFQQGSNVPQTPPINQNAWMPKWGLFDSNVLVMILVVLISWFIMNFTTSGYEWRISGQNSLFSRLGGVNVNKNYLIVMLLTGAIAGLAGGLVIMAGPHRFIKDIGANYAWDGIMIAMVANSGVILTLIFGLFFAILQTGGLGMQLQVQVPLELIRVLQAMIVLILVSGRGYFDALIVRREAKRKVKGRVS